ncbi:hypothetical protein K9N68_29485 [Kovacikia minuta CCNUW1]|uniref:hypothetical protein n=1 Tax=Kovacikia minuta TaxID=2931930 RepID=UPI001CD0106E|nr:hypothetical protein [Kovacikia minuta]UBF25648.1 hypothetical protein K9N68_29485 [Kovacikia minuta CCNUW1]
MNTLDDATLIQQFVKREVTLVSNQNLRVESAFDSVQLLAKRGGLIATIKQVKGIDIFAVRRSSEYGQQVHESLVDNNFIPTKKLDKSEFWQYEECQPSPGYKLHCTAAKFLWKEWWTSVRYSNRNAIQTDLLIRVRDTWYPIREAVCSQGLLYITTLVSEFVFQGSDQIIWLSKLPNQPLERQPKLTPVSPQPPAPPGDRNPPSPPLGQPFFKHPGGGKDLPAHVSPSTPTEVPLSRTQEDSEHSTYRPDLREVVEIRQGKLYIMTALGEVVVEGTNLKFRLNDETPSTKKPIRLNTYRDREPYAVNT